MDPFVVGVGFGDVDIRDVWGRPKQWRNAEAAALHCLCVGEVGVEKYHAVCDSEGEPGSIVGEGEQQDGRVAGNELVNQA